MTTRDFHGEGLVFVVGAPRSGTTWLQRLLAAHPRVATGQESHLFSEFVGPQLRAWRKHLRSAPVERGGVGPGCYHTEEQFLAILRDYMLRLLAPLIEARGEAELFVEKTPGHALYVAEIHELLPEARFIHIIRDARDVVVSLLTAAGSWGQGWAPERTARAALLWERHVRSARTAGRALGARRYHEVHYEELARDGAPTLERLFDFVGLPVERTAIERWLEDNRADAVRAGGGTPIPLGGAFGGATGGVVREPDGFMGPARVGAWRGTLSLAQRAVVWHFAGRTMREAGYDTLSPRASSPRVSTS